MNKLYHIDIFKLSKLHVIIQQLNINLLISC